MRTSAKTMILNHEINELFLPLLKLYAIVKFSSFYKVSSYYCLELFQVPGIGILKQLQEIHTKVHSFCKQCLHKYLLFLNW